MEMAMKECFLDKDRSCTDRCKAYKEKDDSCRIIDFLNTLTNGFESLHRWLRTASPPKIT